MCTPSHLFSSLDILISHAFSFCCLNSSFDSWRYLTHQWRTFIRNASYRFFPFWIVVKDNHSEAITLLYFEKKGIFYFSQYKSQSFFKYASRKWLQLIPPSPPPCWIKHITPFFIHYWGSFYTLSWSFNKHSLMYFPPLVLTPATHSLFRHIF